MPSIDKVMLSLLGISLPPDRQETTHLDLMLDQMDAKLASLKEVVEPAASSSPRTPFDTTLPPEEVSFANFSVRQVAKMLPLMAPLAMAMRKSSNYYDGSFEPSASEASPEFLARLEAGARERGAVDLRFVEIPRNAIFAGKGAPGRYAVVFTVGMDKAKIDTAPSFEAMHAVIAGYRDLAAIANWIADELRAAGFAGYPGTALGGLTDYPYLAELAGLGAIGYHGLLIAPDGGARLRLNTVYTNIENLPLAQTEAHAWVREFCASCRKCVRKCPADAIYEQPRPRPDGASQCIDHGTCRDYFSRNWGCAVCLSVCPFSQAGYDTLRDRFKGNPGAPRFRLPVLGDVAAAE